MPILFSNNAGRVTSLSDKAAAGAISLGNVLDDGNLPISYANHRTIITRIGLSAAGNFQFLHTIGNDVFVYVFGDRMGMVNLHGLSFAQACPPPENQQPEVDNSDNHGFELLYKWYQTYRIAARKAPVTVAIGNNTRFQGFVTGLSGDVQDSMHRTIQFQMTIATLPDV